MPNEHLVFSSHYLALLPLTCFPRIKFHISNASVNSYSDVFAVYQETPVTQWTEAKGEKLKCIPVQTVLKQFRLRPYFF